MKERGLLIYTEEIGSYWLNLILQSDINVVGIHPFSLGGDVQSVIDSTEDLIKTIGTKEYEDFATALIAKGKKIEYELHAISWLIPRELFQEHREYFRVDDKGVRTNDYNMCPSNKEALKLLEKRSEELASKLKYSSDKYYFWRDDIGGMHCHCEQCAELTPSDQTLIICNHMLRGIRRFNKKAKCCYLAYHDTIKPPTKVKPDEGIFLEYAPIKRDSHVPMSSETCQENILERQYLEELLAYFGSTDGKILEYWMDNSRFCNWKKPYKELVLNEAVLKEDLRYYGDLGFISVGSFACFLGEDYAEEFGTPPIEKYGRILSQAK